MLTEFGKCLRKIRIDNQELLKNMADSLGVSSAYLSAVETGKRKAPAAWVGMVVSMYKLSEEAAKDLQFAYDQSTQEIKIRLSEASQPQRQAVLSFAKELENLSDEDLRKIMEVVNKSKRGGCHV